MMEQDFDEIGRRLYDLEADPPDDGWKRIGGTLNPTGRLSWIRKNWWTPLIVMIPALFYFGYHELNGTKSTVGIQADITRIDAQATPDLVTPANEMLPAASTDKTNVSKISETLKKNAHESPKASSVILSTAESNAKDSDTVASNETAAKIYSNASIPVSPMHEDVAADVRSSDATTNTGDKESLKGIDGIREETTVVMLPKKESSISDSRVLTSPAATTTFVSPGSSTTDSSHDNAIASEKTEGSVAGQIGVINNPLQKVASHSNDSTVTIARQSDADKKIKPQFEKEPNSVIADDLDSASENSIPTWRINVSVMPQYLNRTIQPLATDDVLVTNVESNTSPTRTGMEIGVGVARSISNSWYLDARLSYNNLKQEITHSSSDGEVDTLISVKQSDGTIRVTPVYQVINREIRSDYHFINLSLGTTYYFWSTAKTRFNLSASADLHQLLSAEIEEKINGEWVSLGDHTTSKTNVSFTIGMGYNVNLYAGWELMIRPSLRYFIGDIESTDLPYKLNQQAMGIHFMLSKTIGNKQ